MKIRSRRHDENLITAPRPPMRNTERLTPSKDHGALPLAWTERKPTTAGTSLTAQGRPEAATTFRGRVGADGPDGTDGAHPDPGTTPHPPSSAESFATLPLPEEVPLTARHTDQAWALADHVGRPQATRTGIHGSTRSTRSVAVQSPPTDRSQQIEDQYLGFLDGSRDANAALDAVLGLGDPDFEDTIEAMARKGTLTTMLTRIGDRARSGEFLRAVGSRTDDATIEKVFQGIPLMQLSPDAGVIAYMQQHMANFGPRHLASPAARATVNTGATEPFSGGGAQGSLASDAPMSFAQMWRLKRHAAHAEEVASVDEAKYRRISGAEMVFDWSNPIKGGLSGASGYLGTLSASERHLQAEALFLQPVQTHVPEAYGSTIPTRAQVIRAAAHAYDLEPELVAAVILAEQRDQSQNEDAADYQAAVWAGRSSSVGLGQVTTRTAQRSNLFADLVHAPYEARLTGGSVPNGEVARLLSSDELNIFATARYIREVADLAASKPTGSLPSTEAMLGSTPLSDYANHSSTWTDAQILLLGSEYTSSPFDDRIFGAWGEFVLEAYRDVQGSSTF
ncbi:MAG: hypothetical protein RIT81_28900 [Deltaproteobacteria bacterium]